MKAKTKYFLIFLCLFQAITFSFSQADKLPQISILTCAPGTDIYEIYGHNAIRIKTDDQDLVYNYGTFNFRTPNFTIKFMRGKLPYRLSVDHYSDFLMEYNYRKRGVVEQVLDLDSTQVYNVINFLENNAKPENREYKYDFFYDNCATRIYDVLSINLGQSLKWQEQNNSKLTFREIIKIYQAPSPWVDFGVDLIIGAKADIKTTLFQEMFIPDFLMQDLKDATNNGKPLVKQTDQILIFDAIEKKSFWAFFFTPVFVFLLLLLFEINLFFRWLKGNSLGLIKKYDKFWFILLTFTGLLMLIMWFATDHIPTKINWNIMWANPLWLIFMFDSLTKFRKLALVLLSFLVGLSFLNGLHIPLLPQYFHTVVALICIILSLKLYRKYSENSKILKSKTTL